MIIGGFHPLSLSDFPSIPAAVVFLQGCNWNCWYCHNRQLLPQAPQENSLDEEWVLTTLEERKALLNGVVISGGEPTLQPGLPDFMEKIKEMGYQVKLDTNGTQPTVIKDILNRQLSDFIAMDIKGPWSKYEQIVGKPVVFDTIKESIKLISESGIPHQFRTTMEPKYLTEDDLNEMKSYLPASSQYTIQPYKKVAAS